MVGPRGICVCAVGLWSGRLYLWLGMVGSSDVPACVVGVWAVRFWCWAVDSFVLLLRSRLGHVEVRGFGLARFRSFVVGP